LKAYASLCALLLGCGGALQAQAQNAGAGEPGACLSLAFGNGRMHGENDRGTRSMRGRALEVRAGHEADTLLGPRRIDFVHYNEGHPANNHRDGFALQWDRGNLLISLQAERALSRETRAFIGINRIMTFRETNDRDLFQIGLLRRF
jgi:hypothetical protein